MKMENLRDWETIQCNRNTMEFKFKNSEISLLYKTEEKNIILSMGDKIITEYNRELKAAELDNLLINIQQTVDKINRNEEEQTERHTL